ncbi:S-layer family protein [Calothrix sp. PCC 7507]|uniref:two-partner secretion domain-containing protein n=1 Tax=Calothrix sp. PCC 7507 TaxID=99598 RepID=UPI00029EF9AF|nr:S-layer family protein [Calothrix sp. PCC 7507]AFY34509.1 filamentous hemagglutinin family outer membrane protein [Calothrix sp. PCC 7507]
MAQIWQYLVSISTLFSSIFFINLDTKALAQSITIDGTLGTPQTLTGPDYVIPQAAGQAVGNNLFHSFGKFNLNSNEAAIFQSNPNIQNILSRVTGGSQSLIDGLIRTQTGVNLFLINPNGIIFGQNARLDVGGSFVASTANALQFGNLGFFSATEKNVPSPLLTINPSALFFNQINQNAAIQNNSVAPAGTDPAGFRAFGLRVPDGKSLLLVGGNVSMDGGQLNANGGRVELGGLAAPGNVNLLFNGDNLSLQFPENITRADVSLTNQAFVSVARAGGGDITVNARNLEMFTGSLLFTGIRRGLGTTTTVAGDITLNATNNIKVVGSGVVNQILPQATGNAGNINITATTLSLSERATLSASTFGSGKAGNITIRASDFVDINKSNLSSQADQGSIGSAGDVTIETGRLFVGNNAQISTGTIRTSTGAGGNLTINALNSVDLANNSGIFTDTEGIGAAGDLKITTRHLNVQDGGVIFGGTSSTGRGGNMTINALSVDIIGVSALGNYSGILSESTGFGDAGTIIINGDRLSIQGGGVLAARTSQQGKGGTITINASDTVELSGTAPNGSVTSLSSQTRGTGAGGALTINTRQLKVENGAQISVSTFGQGKGGNLQVAASDLIELRGRSQSGFSSGLFAQVNARGTGDAGNLTVTTRQLTLNNGAKISVATLGAGQGGNLNIMTPGGAIALIGTAADGTSSSITAGTDGTGKAGNVTITTAKLVVQAGAAVQASTQGFGEGGTLTINASDSINLEGVSADGRFFSGLTTQTLGAKAAGNLTLNTAQLNIQNGAGVSVGSLGTGKAGDLEINARFIQLDNRGSIFSGTYSGDGGNISLRLQDLLLLRRNSFISATAGTAQQGGNGGNITINTPFIVAVPNENNDITANAFTGTGGKVTINATGIYGITPRSREDLVKLLGTNEPKDLNPAKLPTSDITAISQTSPTLNGDVILNTPDLDPSRGLTELPANLVDVSQQIAQGCTPKGKIASRFISTGRGGLPLNPDEPLRGRAVITNWVTLGEGNQEREITQRPTPETIVEAQGWIINADGNVELVASVPSSSYGVLSSSCDMR